jgi:hypothetical protein
VPDHDAATNDLVQDWLALSAELRGEDVPLPARSLPREPPLAPTPTR